MSRLNALLLPLAAALLLVAAPVASAKTVNDSASGSVTRTGGSGSTMTYSGTMKSSAFGTGKISQNVKLDGLTVTGTYTIVYKGGTLRGTVSAKAKLTTKGATFSGTSRVTGGTGKFKNASGSASYSGTAKLDMSGTTFTQRGTISY